MGTPNARQLRGIDHHQHHVGTPAIGIAPKQYFKGNLFIGGAGRERVAAGEVEYRDPTAVRSLKSPLYPFNRDAGEIAHPLAQTGERVKQRRFPGVRVADNRHAQRTLRGITTRLTTGAVRGGHGTLRRRRALHRTHWIRTHTRACGRALGRLASRARRAERRAEP